MKFFIVLLASVFTFSAVSAQKIDRSRFANVDSFVRELGPMEGHTLKYIVDTLRSPWNDQLDVARALFTWVATNIEYDIKGAHHPKQYNPTTSATLVNRKGTCQGYTNLYKSMCDLANIECVIIDGKAKGRVKDIGKAGGIHGWNAIRVKNTWYLIDPTFGAGGMDEKEKHFIPKFKDVNFLPDRHLFALNHNPRDEKWQCLEKPKERVDYILAPVIGISAFKFGIYPAADVRGKIRGKEDTTTHLTFGLYRPEDIKMVAAKIDDEAMMIPYEIKADSLYVKIPFKKKGDYPVHLIINNEHAFSFLAHVRENKKRKSTATKRKRK